VAKSGFPANGSATRSVYQIFSMDSRQALHSALTTQRELARASECQLAPSTLAEATEVDAHIIVLDPQTFGRDERLMVLVDRTFERQLAVKHDEVSRSEERYRALFDKSKVPMLLIDPADGSIVRSNGAAQRFYGYPMDLLQDMHIADINCLSPAQTRAEMQRAEAELREHFFFVHRLADGRTVDVEVHSGDEIDGRTLLYSIIHDIPRVSKAQKRPMPPCAADESGSPDSGGDLPISGVPGREVLLSICEPGNRGDLRGHAGAGAPGRLDGVCSHSSPGRGIRCGIDRPICCRVDALVLRVPGGVGTAGGALAQGYCPALTAGRRRYAVARLHLGHHGGAPYPDRVAGERAHPADRY
jgi:PAS domain S-box-containing protein